MAVCRPVRPFAKRCWIPIRLQRLIPSWGSLVVTATPPSAGSTLLCSVPSQFELRLGYFTINGNLFNLPAGPVSFAVGGEYRGEQGRLDPSSAETTFDAEVGSTNSEAPHGSRDVWATYQEVRFPVTSPVWNFPGAYSLEFDIAEREEWYSQNTNAILPIRHLPFVPAGHSTYDAQKPKFSVRWQPLDPKWVGALTLRGSYSEAFHAPPLPDLNPAGRESAAQVFDPRGKTPPRNYCSGRR